MDQCSLAPPRTSVPLVVQTAPRSRGPLPPRRHILPDLSRRISLTSPGHTFRRSDNKQHQPSCSRTHQIPNQFPRLPIYLGGVSPCVAGDPAEPRCLCGGPRLVNVTHEPSLRVHCACAGASGTTNTCVEFGTRERLPPRSCQASPRVTRRRKFSNELMANRCL